MLCAHLHFILEEKDDDFYPTEKRIMKGRNRKKDNMICVYKYFSTKKKEMCKPQNDFEKFNKISSILLPLFSYEISIEKVSQT